MILTDESTETDVILRMQVERQSMTTFPIPEIVAKYPIKWVSVKDEHGNAVSGYIYTVYAEYIELYPAVFPNWTLELHFEKG